MQQQQMRAANHANLGALRTRNPPVLRHQPSHSCTVCAECSAASAALHRTAPNVRFSEKPFCLQPRVEKPSGARRSRHALSRMALVPHRVCRARLLARPLASAARF
jgi:hypothetical protein